MSPSSGIALDALAGGPATASPGAALLSLLVSGHLLAEFAFQTRWMVREKPRPPALLAHGLEVAAVHAAVLLPFMGLFALLAVAGIAVLHTGVDGARAALGERRGAPLTLFLLDQAAHLLVLGTAWIAVGRLAGPLPLRLPEAWLGPWTATALAAGALAFTWTGGSALVSATLATLSPGLEDAEDASSGVEGSGRLIGMLERTITVVLVLLGQWGALALLLAAKSIARFEELKERRFAEYYLVGTLSSLLVAILVGLALGWALGGGAG